MRHNTSCLTTCSTGGNWVALTSIIRWRIWWRPGGRPTPFSAIQGMPALLKHGIAVVPTALAALPRARDAGPHEVRAVLVAQLQGVHAAGADAVLPQPCGALRASMPVHGLYIALAAGRSEHAHRHDRTVQPGSCSSLIGGSCRLPCIPLYSFGARDGVQLLANAATLCAIEQVYIYRFIQLFIVAFALGTVFVKTRMSTTTLQVTQPTCKTFRLWLKCA